jgi:endonuclease/exonuclease/phosphatase (EEP) superfamily protein YafD
LIRECLLCAPGWGLNSREVGDALAVVSHPILVLGDFNSHSQSWVVTQKTVVRVRFRVCSMDLTWSILMTERSLELLHHL